MFLVVSDCTKAIAPTVQSFHSFRSFLIATKSSIFHLTGSIRIFGMFWSSSIAELYARGSLVRVTDIIPFIG